MKTVESMQDMQNETIEIIESLDSFYIGRRSSVKNER